jgi:hypothetical protein
LGGKVLKIGEGAVKEAGVLLENDIQGCIADLKVIFTK